MSIESICQSLNLENEKSIALFSIDENFKITSWSSGCQEFFGYSQNDVINRSIFETILPEYIHESYKKDLNSKNIDDFSQIEYKTKENKTILLNTIVRYINHNKYFLLTPYIQKKENKLSKLITSLPAKDVVISLDRNGYIQEFNKEAENLTGYSSHEVKERNFVELFVPKSHKEKVLNQIQYSFRVKSFEVKDNFPILCKDKSKKIVDFEFKFFNHRHRDLRLFLIAKNQTKQSRKTQSLDYLASYDSLTDLPNKNLFKKNLQESMNSIATKKKQSLLLLYLDIKNFSSINYTLGTQTGDLVLQMVATKLNNQLRDYDIVARVGSNKFAVIFNNLPDEIYSAKIVDRVLSLFEDPFEIEDVKIDIDVYIGATLYPSDGNDIDKLISNAELALSKAKKSSKSSYKFFMPSMYDEISRKHEIKQSIKEALEKNQFYVVFQPQVDSQTYKVSGVEALVRWNHPKLKDIPPLDFIPVAEDNGLILEIGKLVLEDSIKKVKSLHEEGWRDLNLSVNISAIQLLQSDLIKTVTELIKKYDFNPSHLHLEITESIFMQNLDLSKKLLNQFRDIGVKISIDDFGTGFSSLSYISKLPIDILKIDQAFVKDINKDDSPIINAIISMAHSLGMKVVAEGVENKVQFDYLQEKSCDFIQGFYFSKPISYEKLHLLVYNSKILPSNTSNTDNKASEKELKDLLL